MATRAWSWLRLVIESHDDAPNPSDVTVAAAIATHVNNRTGQAWPSVNTLAAETRLDRKAVLHAISRLEDTGLLTVNRQPGRGNHYTVADPGPRRDTAAPARRDNRSPQRTGPLSGPVADRSPQRTRTVNREPSAEVKAGGSRPPARAARTRTSLEPDLLATILELRGADSRTATTVTAFARRGLPEAAFRNALEATLDAHGRLQSTEIAYFVGTLQQLESSGQYG